MYERSSNYWCVKPRELLNKIRLKLLWITHIIIHTFQLYYYKTQKSNHLNKKKCDFASFYTNTSTRHVNVRPPYHTISISQLSIPHFKTFLLQHWTIYLIYFTISYIHSSFNTSIFIVFYCTKVRSKFWFTALVESLKIFRCIKTYTFIYSCSFYFIQFSNHIVFHATNTHFIYILFYVWD